MKKKLITLLAIITTLNSNAQLCFGPPTYYTETIAMSLTNADFNNDGKMDIATIKQNGTVSVRLGTGTGSFGASTTFTVGTVPDGIISADFNKDGNVDLANTNYNSNNISVLLGNGLGGFATAVNYPVGVQPIELLSADFDADGNMDLAVTNAPTGPGSVSILMGSATGVFATAINYTTGNRPQDITGADFNSDGKIDLATVNRSSNNVGIIFGTGTGSFGPSTIVMTGTVLNSPISIAGGDFNSDGKTDLVVSNYNVNYLSVALNTGTGTFGAITNYTVGTNPYGIIVADLNSDGKDDIVSSDINSSTLSILAGNGTGSFALPVAFTMNKPGNVISADFDGDGKPDLASSSFNDNNIGVLLNCAITSVMERIINDEIIIYPNPSAGKFTLQITKPQAQVEIYNSVGEKVFSNHITQKKEIDISQYGQGIYFIKIYTDSEIVSRRIVIEN